MTLPTEEQPDAIEEALRHIKASKSALDRLGPSREKALAQTKLDEALLWIGAMP